MTFVGQYTGPTHNSHIFESKKGVTILLMSDYLGKGPTQKFFKKKLKYTYADFVQNCLGIPKIYAACLSDVS